MPDSPEPDASSLAAHLAWLQAHMNDEPRPPVWLPASLSITDRRTSFATAAWVAACWSVVVVLMWWLAGALALFAAGFGALSLLLALMEHVWPSRAGCWLNPETGEVHVVGRTGRLRRAQVFKPQAWSLWAVTKPASVQQRLTERRWHVRLELRQFVGGRLLCQRLTSVPSPNAAQQAQVTEWLDALSAYLRSPLKGWQR